MSCTSLGHDELNKHISCGTEGATTLIVTFGPYMNWGRWNHNDSRIQEVVEELTSKGFNVELKHDSKETTQANHGFVTISAEDGTELTSSSDLQHNRNYSTRAANSKQIVVVAIQAIGQLAAK